MTTMSGWHGCIWFPMKKNLNLDVLRRHLSGENINPKAKDITTSHLSSRGWHRVKISRLIIELNFLWGERSQIVTEELDPLLRFYRHHGWIRPKKGMKF